MPSRTGNALNSSARSIVSAGARSEYSLVIAFVVLLHVLGWGILISIASTEHLMIGTTVFGVGLGLTAYLLGVRHAFDADHIAAIDNTTRKLIQERRPPSTVGFWFSCGHSTVVFALTVLIVLGVKAIVGPALDGNSDFRALAGLIGTVTSGGFLYAIAAVNIFVLIEIVKAIRQARSGLFDEEALNAHLNNRGFVNRLLGRLNKVITKPHQMYFVGLLFGLGFDTATEIALLVVTSSGAASNLPWYAILSLPILFAAGMSLFDTLQGSLMTAAYGWALRNPMRKLHYNLTVTSLSIVVAFVIGTIEAAGLLGERQGLNGAFFNWTSSLDLSRVGIGVALLFILTWAVAAARMKSSPGTYEVATVDGSRERKALDRSN